MYSSSASTATFYPKTSYPDILSAPAPVLRDQDILIDGETVAHLPPGASYTEAASTVADDDNYSVMTESVAPSSYPYPSSSRYQQQQQPQNQYHHQSFSSARPPPSTIITSSSSSSTQPYHPNRSSTLVTVDERDNTLAQQQQQSSYHYDPYAASSTAVVTSTSGLMSETALTPYEYDDHDQPLVDARTHKYINNMPTQVKHMKQRRKVATVAAGVAGGVVGIAVLGPFGAVAGGVGAAVATKQVGKRLEKRVQKKVEAERFAQEERRHGRDIPALQGEYL